MAMAINWNFANCSCPAWNSSMDESALRRALDSLVDCSSSQHWWLGFWTLLVAIGVALEIVFVVWEYVKDRRDCRLTLLRPPVKPNLPLFVLGFFGAAMVAGGVSGELYVESKISSVETCIRKGNDQVSLLLSKEAGDAAQSAQIAHDEADSVKVVADGAKTDAGGALARAGGAQASARQARQQADTAEKHLADALKQAADTQAEINRLKSPRSLTNIPEMVKSLSNFKGTEYTFLEVAPEQEATDLLKSLDGTLQQAGWKRGAQASGFPSLNIYGDGTLSVPVSLKNGVHVTVQSETDFEILAKLPEPMMPSYIRAGVALLKLLALHLTPEHVPSTVEVEKESGSPHATVFIIIGKKP